MYYCDRTREMQDNFIRTIYFFPHTILDNIFYISFASHQLLNIVIFQK